MNVLEGLNPERVFYYFERLCGIPHGSKNTKAISEFCAEFAKNKGLEFKQDDYNNIVIFKPASKGYEKHDPVILQGHLDMVCEKETGLEFNFETDGIKIEVNGDFISAKSTTLGADNGIAVAMVLAILEDDSIAHPPLEALFSTDEEIGMLGAVAFDASVLKGKMLINLDSEEEGIIIAGCAGGAGVCLELPVEFENQTKECYKISVSGLLGGHSGVEIDKGRLNASIVLKDTLKSIDKDFSIISVSGGEKDNAIPCNAQAIIACDHDLSKDISEFANKIKTEKDPGLKIRCEKVGEVDRSMTSASTKRLLEFLDALPNGIISMSPALPDFPQTSLNLGVMKTMKERVVVSFACRSSVKNELLELIDRLQSVAEQFGCSFNVDGCYPAWEYRPQSRLRDTLCETYARLFCSKPTVEVIHAGLECGVWHEKIQDLDAVSFGPQLYDVHTINEQMSISSTERTYRLLTELIKSL